MSIVHPIKTDPDQVQEEVCDHFAEAKSSGCCQTSNELTEADMTKRAKLNKRWHRRLKFLFCCLGYKKNKVSSDMRQLLID